MDCAGHQTDEPVLLHVVGRNILPSRARPVPFTVWWRKGGTRPARAEALHSLRAILPHLLFYRTSTKSGKNPIPLKNSLLMASQ